MPEITEHEIRLRVEDPSGFEQDSFRYTTLSDKEGIKAVIGKKKGATSTSIQSLRFDKSKWSMDEAKKWATKHNYSLKASISYPTSYTVEFLTAEGKKFVRLRGKLLNDKINANHWGVKVEDFIGLAQSYVGKDIKVQHSINDWDIIGKFAEVTANYPNIDYVANITDSRAVDKFETNTWTVDNMGISPSVGYSSVECNICSKQAGKCNHKIGSIYDNKIAGVIPINPYGTEGSLTSNPAYRPVGSGTIDEIDIKSLIASVTDDIKNNLEVDNMADEALIAQKDATILEQSTKLEAMTNEIGGMKKSMSEMDKCIGEMKTHVASLDKKNIDLQSEKKSVEDVLVATATKLDSLIASSREAELLKIVSDKTLVAEILAKKMTDEEFTAEVKRTQKLKELMASGTGSAPSDGNGKHKSIFEAEFGQSYDNQLKAVLTMGGK